MNRLSHQDMVTAMTQNDASLNGQFWVGVQSTKIYCLPSCKAKLPLLRNVIFYASREEAIAAGLRGCKRCKSDLYPDVLPEWYTKTLQYMAANPSERLTESILAEMAGVEISTVRRQFREQLGETPLAFHRRLRLERAQTMLAGGENYLGVAYDCGWESASAFRDAYKKHFGVAPGESYVE